ncbi:hypothetical protein PVL29_012779 [Vitis rotundifolia]|uniref:Protein ARV n=1 Tax=Vitis rotundifolia TaxID=103349 RepID=A0AA39DNU8_VITRO|nr:hypothetical protein PVL29_012779 [Vitis rotundifolia]
MFIGEESHGSESTQLHYRVCLRSRQMPLVLAGLDCVLYKILMDVLFGNLAFLCIFLLATRNLLNTIGAVSRYKNLLLSILISSYFKIFFIAMMVWELSSSLIFIIDVFVLSSNAVALKVITGSGMSRCAETCFVAHAVKLFVSQLTGFHSSRFVQDLNIFRCEMPIYSI